MDLGVRGACTPLGAADDRRAARMTGEASLDDVLGSLFPGDSEVARLARATDWGRTPLGDPRTWPPELTAAVRTVLPSEVPMLLWWGPELVQVYNDAYRSVAGRKHPAALGQTAAACWAEIWHEVGPLAARVVEDGRAVYGRDVLLFPDRHGYVEETYWTFSYSPIRSATDEVLGVFVATTDLTDTHVQAQRLEALQEVAELTSTAFASPAEALAEVARRLASHRVPLPFAAFYRRDADDAFHREATFGLGPSCTALPSTISATDSHVVHAAAGSREARTATFDVGELDALPGPLGPALPHEAVAMPLWTAGGAVEAVAVLGVNPYRRLDRGYRDFVALLARQVSVVLSEVRAVAAEREQVAAMAALDRSRRTFFANVSHEFRTPVSVTLAATDQLRRGGEDGARHVDAIERAARRLDRLVDTLLDFARADAGELALNTQDVDLAQVTRDVVGMFRSTLEAGGLAVEVEVGDVGVLAVDPEAWTTIVANLLSNAYKFSTAGAVHVALRRSSAVVELTVRDTGAGIAPQDRDRVFRRFERVVTAPARGIAGTGVGLALVHDLVDALGGEVRLESALGAGTTVTVTVPAREPAGGAAQPAPGTSSSVPALLDEQAATDGAQTSPSPAPPGDGPVLLVVEDHPDLRGYLAALAEGDGWRVVAVPDVATALRTEQVPDVVLSDVMLPGATGIDLVRALRAQPLWAGVPLVLLTARSASEDVVEGLQAGADDYITKPYEPVELLARLRTHHELARARRLELDRAVRASDGLRRALESNRRIGEAVGIVMATYRVTSGTAFAALRRLSNDRNRKLVDVAEEVSTTGELSDTDALDAVRTRPHGDR